jgi:alpha-tubulin suppressor-like RCC1 family protein
VVLPQQVTTPTPGGWSSVTAGYDHTCATRTNRALWCWGLNGDGALGLGFFSSGIDGEQGVSHPRQVTTPAEEGWVTVAAGQAHTCAIRGGGSLWCWGGNGNGQLGIGNDINQDQAQRVTGCAQLKTSSSPRPHHRHPPAERVASGQARASTPHATGKPAAEPPQPSIAR